MNFRFTAHSLEQIGLRRRERQAIARVHESPK
jgi:uncharacterized protein YjiS (DUF1127 family)